MPAALILMNPRTPKHPPSDGHGGTVVLGSAVKAAIAKAEKTSMKKVRSNPLSDVKHASREAIRAAKVAQKAAERAGKIAGKVLVKAAPKPPRANPPIFYGDFIALLMREGSSRKEAEAIALKLGVTPTESPDAKGLARLIGHGPSPRRRRKAQKAAEGKKPKNLMASGMSREEAEAMVDATRRGSSGPRSNPSSRKVTQMARRSSHSPRGGKIAIPARLARELRENPSLSWETLVNFFMGEGSTREEAEAKARRLGASQPQPKERIKDQPDEANKERVRAERRAARQAAAEKAVEDGKFGSTEEYFASKREKSRLAREKDARLMAGLMEKYLREGKAGLTPQQLELVASYESRKARARTSGKQTRHKKNFKNLDKIFTGGKERWPNTYLAREYANSHPSRYDRGGNLARLFVRAKKLDLESEMENDVAAGAIARELGLAALPNPDEGMSMAVVPMMAVSAGAMIGVWAVTAKAAQMIKPKAPAAIQRLVTPALALAIGVGGAWALRKAGGGAAKYSGALLCGAVGTAVAALMASKGADGKALDESYGIALGDYHMGASMTVGDYHMGAVTQLNVGDYHVGAAPGIDVITDRRMLAPPGQPMPRHDTRRDNVDEAITAFNGTLSGDIFDQA